MPFGRHGDNDALCIGMTAFGFERAPLFISMTAAANAMSINARGNGVPRHREGE